MRKGLLIALIIFFGFQIGLVDKSLQFGLAAKAFEIKSIEQKNGKLYLYYDGSLTYTSFYLNKPYRFVVDFIGVKGCSKYKKSVKIFDMGDGIRAKVFMHTNDKLSNSYKRSVLRCAVVFEGYTSKPNCDVKPYKGYVEINCNKNKKQEKVKQSAALSKTNIIERISYRRFNNYEMVVVLLKAKPDYKVKQSGSVIYLTLNNVKALKNALMGQNLSNEAENINSIMAVKTSNNSIRYVIKMKDNGRFKKYYADSRHVYLIFPITQTSSNNKKNSNLISKSEQQTEQANGIFSDDRRVSFNVRDAQLKDIFRVFAKITGVNIIIGDDVQGTITMSLKDVPINQALNLILQQKGLVAERKGNIVVIMTAARYQQEKMAQLKALQEKEKYERMKSAVTKTINLNYITPDYAIGIINKLLYNGGNPKGGGFIVADTKNNALICHDTADNIAKIEKIVQMVDKKKLAVEIDARIVEISKTFERQLGIQWGGNYYNAQLGSSHTFIGVGGYNKESPVKINGSLPPSPNYTNDNFIVNLPATLSDAPTNAVSLAIGNVRAGYNLDLKLTMGEVEGYSKVISSPKVITLNNEAAKIESGQQIPYHESAGASGATSTSFKSATLSLEVTPQITRNNQIILKITVKKDSPDFAHAVNGEPTINTNEVQTTVILKNGQTIVLGGLVQQTNIKTVQGIPLLMRIPFLGWLFKTKRIYNPQKELYIFVTPHILTK
ncbi:type IV pilus secretin PilQ [Hippea jasoniae]|uniref:type IV pilus secretin PilQ n=1 Tax=Hippea jasoniae TaxID=944479 RepID=UPI00054EF73B|nr:type IV pilus secretin PilQ [Hippea jasoniae]